MGPLGALLRQTLAGALSKMRGVSAEGLYTHQACWASRKWYQRGGGAGRGRCRRSAAGVGDRELLTRLLVNSNTVLVAHAKAHLRNNM